MKKEIKNMQKEFNQLQIDFFYNFLKDCGKKKKERYERLLFFFIDKCFLRLEDLEKKQNIL